MARFKPWSEMLAAEKPPARAPYYVDNESYGWEMRQCAINLIGTMAGWLSKPLEFRGDANGRIWHFEGEFNDRAQLLFTSDRGDGIIELSIDASNWVKAELFIGGDWKFRAWIEEPYEEKDIWPDGADGIVPEKGDPPGRISKRGRWLQLRRADFPGAPETGGAYWSVEDTFY